MPYGILLPLPPHPLKNFHKKGIDSPLKGARHSAPFLHALRGESSFVQYRVYGMGKFFALAERYSRKHLGPTSQTLHIVSFAQDVRVFHCRGDHWSSVGSVRTCSRRTRNARPYVVAALFVRSLMGTKEKIPLPVVFLVNLCYNNKSKSKEVRKNDKSCAF